MCVCVCVCISQSVQSLSRVGLCDPVDCSMPGIPVCHQPLEFTQTHVHWVGDAIQPSHPRSSSSPPTFNLSQHQGLFKWVSSLHQVAKVLEFHFNISPSNEYSGLISFTMDWFDLLAVQGIVKSLLQHHSSKTSVLQHSAFFIVQLSHPYTTTGKTIALTRRTFVGFSNGSDGKDPACQRRRCRFNSWRRSPWEGNGNPLHYFCLGSPMDRGAWRATGHEVAKSRTWLSTQAHI